MSGFGILLLCVFCYWWGHGNGVEQGRREGYAMRSDER